MTTVRTVWSLVAVVIVAAALQTSGAAATGPSTVDHSAHGHTPDAAEVAAIAAQRDPVRGSEFRAECTASHRNNDDPVVFPNQVGVSHLHQFFGNTTTDARSTLQSLRLGGTSCQPVADKAAYWVPTLFKNGNPVAPERVTVYYQGITDPGRAVPHPQGLRYVVGNALATRPEDNPSARWSCVGHPQSSRDFLACPAGSKLETYLDFPTCWDGQRLDSPNHRDHLAWGIGGVGGHCPASHPVVLPRLQFLITYPVDGGGLTLAGTRGGVNVTDAPGYTFHGDFMNAWDPAELARRVTDCINAGFVCGTDGVPIDQ